MKTVRLTSICSLEKAIETAISIAEAMNDRVNIRFNGIWIVCTKNSKIDDKVKQYYKEKRLIDRDIKVSAWYKEKKLNERLNEQQRIQQIDTLLKELLYIHDNEYALSKWIPKYTAVSGAHIVVGKLGLTNLKPLDVAGNLVNIDIYLPRSMRIW